MPKIRLAWFTKTDAQLRVLVRDSNEDVVTGATGSYVLKTSGGTTLASGLMIEDSAGWYYFNLVNSLSVNPGDRLEAQVTMSNGVYQTYGEYEIFVKTDRR
jgi:hypothetical protein